MLTKPRTFFAIHRFESKSYEDSAGKIEIREPMVQSGRLGEHETFHFGWDEIDCLDLINQSIKVAKAQAGNAPVVIYGAGAHTTQHWYLFSSLNIVAVADKNESLWGSFLKEKPVISPKQISDYSNHVVISSRAYEENIRDELLKAYPTLTLFQLYGNDYMEKRLVLWANTLREKVLRFQPDLLVHTPTHVRENLPSQFFLELKQQVPNMKILTVWWDYDETNIEAGYLEYERQVLEYADLVIENSNGTRLERMHRNEAPYCSHLNSEKVIFHPSWFDPSLFYNSGEERDIDIALFGSRVGERGRWIDFLEDTYGDRFRHIGGVSGEHRNPIPISEYAALLRRTKVVVNTQTYSFRSQCKGKVRETLQCGAILMEEENSETPLAFPNDDSILYFDSFEGLRDKIDTLIEHYSKYKQPRNEINWVAWTEYLLENLFGSENL
ncbi:glycosyltransferase [Marinomonas balearica]|uniref:Spore protein YkvP/CgeB glycosyl transferase-like domain-containing protein n=1 Tax=Marinomonas balearica TaxID=491947 RepID=A0A4R6M4J9_9GAMM|nr:glycosyltransferase [Marinomonas balearica]TDO96241.1 hypothetical protein DFP79_2813 [Marinomonas balearica]